MADEVGKEEIQETEADRRRQYRKLRAGGMQDKDAMEKVWPSTSAGLKFNTDEKAQVKADKESAGKKKKE